MTGSLEVGYLRELPPADKGPFLVEDRVLLEVAAGRLARLVDRRGYAQELQNQRDFADSLVQTAQAIVLLLDQEGRIVYFNSFLEKLTGYRLAGVRGHAWSEVFLTANPDQTIQALFRLHIEPPKPQPCLVSIRDSHGNLLPVEWRNRTLRRKDGQ